MVTETHMWVVWRAALLISEFIVSEETCPKCSVHNCWRCLGVFAAGEIYSYIMELAHGGMLDGDELWAAAGW